MGNAARWRHKAAHFLTFKSIFLQFPMSEKNYEKYCELSSLGTFRWSNKKIACKFSIGQMGQLRWSQNRVLMFDSRRLAKNNKICHNSNFLPLNNQDIALWQIRVMTSSIAGVIPFLNMKLGWKQGGRNQGCHAHSGWRHKQNLSKHNISMEQTWLKH